MSERGSSKHGPRLDEQLRHEDQPIVQGHGPSHVEEWREAEGVPDDTDSPEVERAYRMRGEQVDAAAPERVDGVSERAEADPEHPDAPDDGSVP